MLGLFVSGFGFWACQQKAAVAPDNQVPIEHGDGVFENHGTELPNAKDIKMAIVWEAQWFKNRKQVQPIQIKTEFPTSFTFDITELPPTEALDQQSSCMLYASGHLVAFLDGNHNQKLDLIPRDSAHLTDDKIIGRAAQTIMYMELSKNPKCKPLNELPETKKMFPFGFTPGTFAKNEQGEFITLKDVKFKITLDENLPQADLCEPYKDSDIDQLFSKFNSGSMLNKYYHRFKHVAPESDSVEQYYQCNSNGLGVRYFMCNQTEEEASLLCYDPICVSSYMFLSNDGSSSDACSLYRQFKDEWPCVVEGQNPCP